MTHITCASVERTAGFRFSQAGLISLLSIGLSAVLLLSGMNWVATNALHGLVMVLSGA